jgi:hypothetical protein
MAKSFELVFGNSLTPNRIFNAISIHSSRRLRNSLRSDMLAARLRRVPSKSELRWLNPQWSLRLFPKTFALYDKFLKSYAFLRVSELSFRIKILLAGERVDNIEKL